jgi:hypothetical protein
MPRGNNQHMSDGTPLMEIRQILFDERKNQPQQHNQPKKRTEPVHTQRVPYEDDENDNKFEEPIPVPLNAVSSPDAVDVLKKVVKISDFATGNNTQDTSVTTNATKKIMNAVIVTSAIFVVLYIMPFIKGTPAEYRTDPMKLLLIAVIIGIVVYIAQKSLQ